MAALTERTQNLTDTLQTGREPAGEIAFEPLRTTDEIAAIAELANIIWHECYTGISSKAQIDYMVETLQSVPAIQKQLADQYTYTLLKLDGELVGYIGVQPQDERLFLSKLYLLKEHRGKGHSKRIFQHIDVLACSEGCDTIWLTVNRKNERAVAAYKKAGFTVVREQDIPIGDGHWMNDYIMEKKHP